MTTKLKCPQCNTIVSQEDLIIHKSVRNNTPVGASCPVCENKFKLPLKVIASLKFAQGKLPRESSRYMDFVAEKMADEIKKRRYKV